MCQSSKLLNSNQMKSNFSFKNTIVTITGWKEYKEDQASKLNRLGQNERRLERTMKLVFPRLSTWSLEPRGRTRMKEQGAQPCCPARSAGSSQVTVLASSCCQLEALGSDVLHENCVQSMYASNDIRPNLPILCKLICIIESNVAEKAV